MQQVKFVHFLKPKSQPKAKNPYNKERMQLNNLHQEIHNEIIMAKLKPSTNELSGSVHLNFTP